MIYATNIRIDHLLGGLIPKQFELRHGAFKMRQDYNVPTFDGMEYDQFDTPATNYLVWIDDDGIVRGISRKTPTDRPYMIQQIWPGIITKMALPHSATIWESTRFAVDKNLPTEMRRRIVGELVCAGLEFGLYHGIEGYVGVMPPAIWKSVFCRSGWPIEHIGPVCTLDDGEKIVAGWMGVKEDYLNQVKRIMQIDGDVIRNIHQLKSLK